jgi:hypothetical protein
MEHLEEGSHHERHRVMLHAVRRSHSLQGGLVGGIGACPIEFYQSLAPDNTIFDCSGPIGLPNLEVTIHGQCPDLSEKR